jgi:hypothetical protein
VAGAISKFQFVFVLGGGFCIHAALFGQSNPIDQTDPLIAPAKPMKILVQPVGPDAKATLGQPRVAIVEANPNSQGKLTVTINATGDGSSVIINDVTFISPEQISEAFPYPCCQKPPVPPTAAQMRQQAALINDRLGPLQAPRYGKMERVPAVNRDLPVSEAYAQGYRALKRLESSKALAFIEVALSKEANNPVLLQMKAIALYDLGMDQEAAKAARQGITLAKNQPGAEEEISKLLEPIQGHRRDFLTLAYLHDLAGPYEWGPPSGSRTVLPQPALNTDKPKVSTPRPTPIAPSSDLPMKALPPAPVKQPDSAAKP